MTQRRGHIASYRAVPASGWQDVSVPIHSSMVHWPGDPPVRVSRVSDVERGDSHTLSEISMGSHTGTHIDAPLHFFARSGGIDAMPLDVAIGRARVIEIKDAVSIRPEELAPQRIRRRERLLFKTQNSVYAWRTGSFVENFVYLTSEAAEFLASREVKLVGIDYLSVGGYERDGSQVHRVLLGAGIWLLEGLDLSLAKPGKVDLICLPLRFGGGDGAPARAIIRQVSG